MRLTALFFLLLPSLAFSWGQVGHYVVCEIAYEELTPEAKAEVDRLLELEANGESFASSCVFADFPERQRPAEHYVNFPRNTRSVATLTCPMAEECVLTAIPRDAAIFRVDSLPDTTRLRALKMLGHWVADVHQPMHTSFGDDAGANRIQTTGACEGNLHATWDSCILETLLGNDHREIASILRASITSADRREWQYDGPVEWANESFQIAISKATQYCVPKEGACWYEKTNFILSPGEEQKTIEIRPSYLKRHGKTIEQRLKQAGVRLAALINRSVAAIESPPGKPGN